MCFQNVILAGPTVLTPAIATGALTIKCSCLRQERSVRGSIMDTWPQYTTGTPTTSWSASPHICLQVKQTHGSDFTGIGTMKYSERNGIGQINLRLKTFRTLVTLMVQENMQSLTGENKKFSIKSVIFIWNKILGQMKMILKIKEGGHFLPVSKSQMRRDTFANTKVQVGEFSHLRLDLTLAPP